MGRFQAPSPPLFLSPLSGSPAHSQRLVNVKSRLKQAPRYPSLNRELVEYQERQLFEYFVVVSLHKKQAGAAYVPEVTQQFPLKVQGGQASAACQRVTGQGSAPERVCLGQLVVCGLLTSCRRDFTTPVQVTVRVCLLKLGTVKQGKS